MSSKINQAHTKEVKMKLRQLDYILVWDLDCRNKVLALNYYGSKLVKSKKIKEDIYHDRDDIICKMNIWYLRNFFLEVIFFLVTTFYLCIVILIVSECFVGFTWNILWYILRRYQCMAECHWISSWNIKDILAEILNVLHVANIISKHIMIIPPGVLTFRITFSLS